MRSKFAKVGVYLCVAALCGSVACTKRSAPEHELPREANRSGLQARSGPSVQNVAGPSDDPSEAVVQPSVLQEEAPAQYAPSLPAQRASGSLGTIGSGYGGGGRGLGTIGLGALAGAAGDTSREQYEHVRDTGFSNVADRALSTFSIDVDTASYANVRRFLESGSLPPPDAVRVEELINYFDYGYAQPTGEHPFAVHTELVDCPWAPSHQLLRVGIQGRDINTENVPPRNLVFLLDVSGSMNDEDKLPLLKSGLAMLVRNLRAEDRVSIVVYAGAAGAVLDPTSGANQGQILSALERLQAGGSTNGAQGIELAYAFARRNFMRDGINRVILATDGDFNVGTTSHGDLVRLIEEQRRSGVFLSVLGFGSGNLQDHTMEALADNGNGNYAYIDSIHEAERVLVRQASATLVTIAKDVKLQVEFNPRFVGSYRLVGYENRRLQDADFNNDARDAGDIGAGHNVTALYELIPPGEGGQGTVDPLRYQAPRNLAAAATDGELATIKVRYKRPDASESILLSQTVTGAAHSMSDAQSSTRFATAIAMFGMMLRNSEFRGTSSVEQVRQLAARPGGGDEDRREFLGLVEQAARLNVGRPQ